MATSAVRAATTPMKIFSGGVPDTRNRREVPDQPLGDHDTGVYPERERSAFQDRGGFSCVAAGSRGYIVPVNVQDQRDGEDIGQDHSAGLEMSCCINRKK